MRKYYGKGNFLTGGVVSSSAFQSLNSFPFTGNGTRVRVGGKSGIVKNGS